MHGVNGNGGINTSLSIAAGALQTLSTGMTVCAHNVANISTANFLPQREYYTTGPNDQGVLLATVVRDNTSLGGEFVAKNKALPEDIENSPVQPNEFLQPSGTEIAYEIPHMITTQRAFEANTKTVTAVDDMLGTLLDIST